MNFIQSPEPVSVIWGISWENLCDIYDDEWIKNRVKNDITPFGPVISDKAEYLSCYIGNEFAGASLLFRVSSVECSAHTFFKKKSAPRFVDMAKSCMKEMFESGYNRISTTVREDMESVVQFAKKVGFKEEGISRESCLVDGKPCNVVMLGILKKEFDSWAS